MSVRPMLLAIPLSLALATAAPALAAPQADIAKVMGTIKVEPAQQAGDLSTVNGRIEVGAGARVGDAETVNGRIELGDGSHAGSLEAVNGRIELGADVQAGEVSTVNGRIHAGERVRLGGDVETVNGGIFIDRGGVIDGDIESVNGAVGLVQVAVTGDVEMHTGDLTVGDGSHVRGGIRYHEPSKTFSIGKRRRPRVVIGAGARVDGTLEFEIDVDLHVHETATIGPVTGAEAKRYSGARAPARGD